jgi:hypothetical protein
VEKDIINSLFNTWSPQHYRIMELDEKDFQVAIVEQLKEIHEHLRNKLQRKTANEIVDIISISINWLRWLGYTPDEMYRAIEERIRTRYKNNIREILDKYDLLTEIHGGK